MKNQTIYIAGVILAIFLLLEEPVMKYQTKYMELKVDSLIIKNKELINRNRDLVLYSDSLLCEIKKKDELIKPDTFWLKFIVSMVLIILTILTYKLYENNK